MIDLPSEANEIDKQLEVLRQNAEGLNEHAGEGAAAA